jgi:hypothetical protein
LPRNERIQLDTSHEIDTLRNRNHLRIAVIHSPCHYNPRREFHSTKETNMKRRFFIKLGGAATAAATMVQHTIANEIVSAANAGTTSSDKGLAIEGKWKLAIEDKKQFSEPSFDDSAWMEVETPSWRQSGNKTATERFGLEKKSLFPQASKLRLKKLGH